MRVLQRNRRMWDKYINKYSGSMKELAHMIVEVDKSKICRVGWQAGDPGKSWSCSWSPKTVWWQNSVFLKEARLFLKAFHWMYKAHPQCGWWAALFKVYRCKCHSYLKNTFTATSRHVWANIWVLWQSH